MSNADKNTAADNVSVILQGWLEEAGPCDGPWTREEFTEAFGDHVLELLHFEQFAAAREVFDAAFEPRCTRIAKFTVAEADRRSVCQYCGRPVSAPQGPVTLGGQYGDYHVEWDAGQLVTLGIACGTCRDE